MELTKCKLGELITQRREKNDGSNLPICGVSKDGLIPPKQIDADTSIYNVFYRDDFIFNPARMELNSIAINDKYDRAICSSLYEVFFVHRTDLLLPHFLKLIVKQKWFTRYCEFLGQGSAREYCRFNNISEIEIEFPPIEEQQRIVDYYSSIQKRIALKKQINDNLEAQAFAIYEETISNREKCAMLSDIAEITMGTSPEGESFNADGIGTVFYQGRTDFGFRFPTIRLYTTEPKRFADKGDILMSVRAPVGDINIAKEHCAIGRGLAALKPKNKCYSYLYYTMMELNFELKKFNDEGTVFGSITKDDLYALNVVALSPDESISFEKKVSIIDDTILQNETEIQHLLEMSSILLSKITD